LHLDRPFPHVRAFNVFAPEFHLALENQWEEIAARGTSATPDSTRLSKNMPLSDAYAWNFPTDIDGPLGIFYSRGWHDLLHDAIGIDATFDVNAALHHHPLDDEDGFVHNDFNVCWFTDQSRIDDINPMDLSNCGYFDGKPKNGGAVSERVRAAAMIYYLANGRWRPEYGGHTGLYATQDAPIHSPDVSIAPIDNSLLAFEITPYSFHAFLRNRRRRNSVILWLHRTQEATRARWGAELTPTAVVTT